MHGGGADESWSRSRTWGTEDENEHAYEDENENAYEDEDEDACEDGNPSRRAPGITQPSSRAAEALAVLDIATLAGAEAQQRMLRRVGAMLHRLQAA